MLTVNNKTLACCITNSIRMQASCYTYVYIGQIIQTHVLFIGAIKAHL